MEESKNNDVIYDLEDEGQPAAVMEGGHPDRQSEVLSSDIATDDIATDNPDSASGEKPTDCASGAEVKMTAPKKEESGPRKKIERMMEEMGAETLLEIIRDNRNAAIRQIIREVEATQRHDLPSGASAARKPVSIFDLAALA